MMAAPEVLLQRPASLQTLLQLLSHPDPESPIPYAVLSLLQCLVSRLKQRLLLSCASNLQCGHHELPQGMLRSPSNAKLLKASCLCITRDMHGYDVSPPGTILGQVPAEPVWSDRSNLDHPSHMLNVPSDARHRPTLSACH